MTTYCLLAQSYTQQKGLTEIIIDPLLVPREGQGTFRLEFKGQVLSQDADPQELEGLLGNLYLLYWDLFASIVPAEHLCSRLCLIWVGLEDDLQHKANTCMWGMLTSLDVG